MPPTEPQTIPFGVISQRKVSRNLNLSKQRAYSKARSVKHWNRKFRNWSRPSGKNWTHCPPFWKRTAIPMCRHSQPPTERQKRSSASTTEILPSGNGRCRKRSSSQKSHRKSKVSGNSFAGSKRKAGRNPSTESGITNGNFDNKKHTAQRKNFRWRCLHSENSSRPGKNAINPMGAFQTMPDII